MEKQEKKQVTNSILIKEGESFEMSGVLRVDDFDKDEINLDTNLGSLIIKGKNLHIAHLLLEEQQLVVEGEIRGVYFEDQTKQKKRGSLLKRLTR